MIIYEKSLCRWLYHKTVGNNNDVIVKDLNILYDLIGSDRLPIYVSLHITSLFNE